MQARQINPTQAPNEPYKVPEKPHVTDVPQPEQSTSPTLSAKDIRSHPYENHTPKDCVPTAIRTVTATVTGADPGEEKTQNDVAKEAGVPGLDWRVQAAPAVSPAEEAQVMKRALQDNNVTASVSDNTDGSGGKPRLDNEVKTITATTEPSIITVEPSNSNEIHAVTVQADKNGNINVNNLDGWGAVHTFTQKEFLSGNLQVGTVLYGVNPKYPVVTATPH